MSGQIEQRIDLRRLTRDAPVPDSRESAPHDTAIPMPRFPWRTRVALPAALLGTVVALLAYTARDFLLPATEVKVVPVVVQAGDGTAVSESLVQAPGWVEPDPHAIAVPALTDGVVREVLVLEGQPVTAGQVVVVLVDDDAKLELTRAEAELSERAAVLEAAQAHWDNPIERTRAAKSAQARVEEAAAELTRSDAEIAVEAVRSQELLQRVLRSRQSWESNAATELEYIEADLQHKGQLARLEAAKARRPVLDAQLAQREADLEAARRGLELRIEETQLLAAGKAAVTLATARRDEARLKLDRTQVRSPADGIVMNRFVEPGTKLVMGMDDVHSSHAVRLYDPLRLQVRVDVPLADAAKVGVGQTARIVVGVLPDHVFDGVVTRVVNEADIQKNTLQVKVAITDPTPDLKPEMLARVRFLSASSPNASRPASAVFAPRRLIQQDGGENVVWLVDARQSIAVRRTVELGEASRDGWVAVKSGLAAGDMLIANAAGLRDGSRVRVTGEAKEGHDGTH